MIYWVFGGTAVGKKRFINRCLDPETRPEFMRSDSIAATWMNEGELCLDIIGQSESFDVLVRWQWGREQELIRILEKYSGIQQSIVMLSTGLIIQLSRIALREGCLMWDAEAIHFEMRSIYELVQCISERFNVPVLYVDSSSSEKYEVRSCKYPA